MTNMPFPQALKDLLQLPNDTAPAVLKALNDGWQKLSLEERDGLAYALATESDTFKRLWIALNRTLPAIYR